jgi:diguanylate cyclase (GGDEF)-like protein
MPRAGDFSAVLLTGVKEAQVSLEQIKVLFVDDEPHILSSLKRSLLREPYQKIFANSAGEALRVIENEQIHVIVCDMKMPRMNGLELLHKVKARSPDTVRLVLSGFTDVEQLIACINTGEIYRYLTKSFDLDSFKQTIHEAIEVYQEKQQRSRQIETLSLRYKKIEQILQKQQFATDELLRLSSLDILTTMPNRESFDKIVDQEWTLARRNRNPISLLLIDIDNLPELKTNNGPVAIETCLQKIAWALRNTLRRPIDMIARYDDEKFAILLPGIGTEGSEKVARRILDKVQALEFDLPEGNGRKRVGISIGMVCKKPALEDLPVQKFITTAGMALSAAQKSGGERWIDMSAELESSLH